MQSLRFNPQYCRKTFLKRQISLFWTQRGVSCSSGCWSGYLAALRSRHQTSYLSPVSHSKLRDFHSRYTWQHIKSGVPNTAMVQPVSQIIQACGYSPGHLPCSLPMGDPHSWPSSQCDKCLLSFGLHFPDTCEAEHCCPCFARHLVVVCPLCTCPSLSLLAGVHVWFKPYIQTTSTPTHPTWWLHPLQNILGTQRKPHTLLSNMMQLLSSCWRWKNDLLRLVRSCWQSALLAGFHRLKIIENLWHCVCF